MNKFKLQTIDQKIVAVQVEAGSSFEQGESLSTLIL